MGRKTQPTYQRINVQVMLYPVTPTCIVRIWIVLNFIYDNAIKTTELNNKVEKQPQVVKMSDVDSLIILHYRKMANYIIRCV